PGYPTTPSGTQRPGNNGLPSGGRNPGIERPGNSGSGAFTPGGASIPRREVSAGGGTTTMGRGR
ncbi:MAG: hypothetical protein K2F77_07380, partial [Muribaculaceae bacterium]|nr:hypothetical protein [Muribaculaceae bacterium]